MRGDEHTRFGSGFRDAILAPVSSGLAVGFYTADDYMWAAVVTVAALIQVALTLHRLWRCQ